MTMTIRHAAENKGLVLVTTECRTSAELFPWYG